MTALVPDMREIANSRRTCSSRLKILPELSAIIGSRSAKQKKKKKANIGKATESRRRYETTGSPRRYETTGSQLRSWRCRRFRSLSQLNRRPKLSATIGSWATKNHKPRWRDDIVGSSLPSESRKLPSSSRARRDIISGFHIWSTKVRERDRGDQELEKARGKREKWEKGERERERDKVN